MEQINNNIDLVGEELNKVLEATLIPDYDKTIKDKAYKAYLKHQEYLRTYRQKHKEEITLKSRDYYKQNEEKFKQYKKQYYKSNEEKQKEYYEKNKAKIKQIRKQYYEKQKINFDLKK